MATGERLGDDRIQQYLGSKEVVVLATLGPDGAPRGMAMWFLQDRDSLVMISVADTHKVAHLRKEPRVAVVAESVGAAGDIRGLAVRGRTAFLEDSPDRRALVDRFLARYHPRLERLWGGRTMPGNRVMFRITPEHVRSWGLG